MTSEVKLIRYLVLALRVSTDKLAQAQRGTGFNFSYDIDYNNTLIAKAVEMFPDLPDLHSLSCAIWLNAACNCGVARAGSGK